MIIIKHFGIKKSTVEECCDAAPSTDIDAPIGMGDATIGGPDRFDGIVQPRAERRRRTKFKRRRR